MAEVVPMRGRIMRRCTYPWVQAERIAIEREYEQRQLDVEIAEGVEEAGARLRPTW